MTAMRTGSRIRPGVRRSVHSTPATKMIHRGLLVHRAQGQCIGKCREVLWEVRVTLEAKRAEVTSD